MKITLEFDEDEQLEARTALDGSAWKALCWDFDQYMRQVYKYGPEEDSKAIEPVREKFYEILNDYELSFRD